MRGFCNTTPNTFRLNLHPRGKYLLYNKNLCSTLSIINKYISISVICVLVKMHSDMRNTDCFSGGDLELIPSADVQVPFLNFVLYDLCLQCRNCMFEGRTMRYYEDRALYVLCLPMIDNQ